MKLLVFFEALINDDHGKAGLDPVFQYRRYV